MSTIYLIFIFLISLTSPVFCYSQILPYKQNSLFDSLIIKIPSLLAAENIHGAAIALVDKTGIIDAKGFGYCDSAHKSLITPFTSFYIGSVTKQITALCFLKLNQSGKIKLNTKVIDLYPGFSIKSQMAGAVNEITMEQLLSHTSGLLHEAPLGGNYDSRPCTFEQHITSFKESWIKYNPGSQYSYSNMGYDLAGYCLQLASGKKFEQTVQENVFLPLQMNSTYFSQFVIPANKTKASGYYFGTEIPQPEKSMLPSGSIYSNVIDLSKLLQMYLGNGIFNGSQFLPGSVLSDAIKMREVVAGQKAGYGLGWEIRQAGGFKEVFHSGSGFGFTSRITFLPSVGLGLVVLCNADESEFCELLSRYFTNEACKLKYGHSISPYSGHFFFRKPERSVLKKIEGTYKGYYTTNQLEVSNDTLYWKRNQEVKVTLFAINDSVFKTDHEELRFHYNKDGFVLYADYLSNFQTDRWFPNVLSGINYDSLFTISEPQKYTGNYQAVLFNVQAFECTITNKDKHLYTSKYGGILLRPFKEGIFFSPDGEAFVFKDSVLSIGGRPYYKQKVN